MSEIKKEIKRWKDIVKKGNLQPDPRDERDYDFGKRLDQISTAPLPGSKDLRNLNHQIEDQGHIGSCVGNASVNMYEILLEKSSNFYDLSRLFVYFIAREEYPSLCCKDQGAHVRDGVVQVQKKGVPKESSWVYDESKVNIRPPETVYQEASGTKVQRYERIYGYSPHGKDDKCIRHTKQALSKGFPVVLGMDLTNAFFSIQGSLNNHNYKGTTNGDAKIGGHAMCIVGYDDTKHGFIVENSWGTGFGDLGYFLLDYDVAFKDIHDAWVVTAFNGVYFEDEWEPDSPIHDTNTLEFNFEVNPGTNYKMVSNANGGTGSLSFEWNLTSGMLTSTLLKDRFTRECFIKSPGRAYTHYGTVSIGDSEKQVQQNFTVNFVDDIVQEFVKRLYRHLLDREAEQGGLDYWTNNLKQDLLTGEGIVLSFHQQPEYTNANYDNRTKILKLYRTMLLREPDQSGWDYWVHVLEHGTIQEIIKGFSHSEEFMGLCASSHIRAY